MSPSNDFSSLLDVDNTLYEVTHFETQPGAMYLSTLAASATGALSVTASKPVDFSSVHGLWKPCAGSVTPWNTHLGGEEYPQDGRQAETATTIATLTGSSNVNLPATLLANGRVRNSCATCHRIHARRTSSTMRT